MGDSTPKNVPIEVDFTGISYNPASNQWIVPPKTPVFTMEKKTKVKAGDNTITWTATGKNPPSGFTPSMPGPTGGIAFTADSHWPYDQPKATAAMVYTVDDNFAEPPPKDTDYPYTVTVTLTSITDASVTRNFTYDPDVQNEGPPPVVNVSE